MGALTGNATDRAHGRAEKRELLDELMTILNETASVDTFGLTLDLLADLGPKAAPAIPAILRNGERLGLLKNHALREDGNARGIDLVGETIQAIRAKNAPPQLPVGVGGMSAAVLGLAVGKAAGGSAPLNDNPRCKLVPKEGERSLKVVVICDVAADLGSRTGLDRDLAYLVRKQLRKRFDQGNVGVSVVPVNQVIRARAGLGERLPPAEVREVKPVTSVDASDGPEAPPRRPRAETCVRFGDFRLKEAMAAGISTAEKRKRVEEARAAFKQALKVDPDCTDARRGLDWVSLLLETAEKKGEPDDLGIGRHFQADYVIALRVHNARFTEEKEERHEARLTVGSASPGPSRIEGRVCAGTLTLSLSVLDVRDPDEDPIHEEVLAVSDNGEAGEALEARVFERKLLEEAAGKVAGRFETLKGMPEVPCGPCR